MHGHMFHTAKITQLFLLFACLENCDPWYAVIEAAMQRVAAELKPDAQADDIRISYYCAAVANLLYRQTIAAQGAVLPTYAGSTAHAKDDAQPCALAERLVIAYRNHAAELLRNDAFVFQGIS